MIIKLIIVPIIPVKVRKILNVSGFSIETTSLTGRDLIK